MEYWVELLDLGIDEYKERIRAAQEMAWANGQAAVREQWYEEEGWTCAPPFLENPYSKPG